MSLAMSFVGTVVLAMAVIVLERKPLLNMGKGVLGYWLFVMSWIPINIVALCNPNLEWKAIPHTRSLRMDQMKDTGAMKGVKAEKEPLKIFTTAPLIESFRSSLFQKACGFSGQRLSRTPQSPEPPLETRCRTRVSTQK